MRVEEERETDRGESLNIKEEKLHIPVWVMGIFKMDGHNQ